jgi:hypothetical protein
MRPRCRVRNRHRAALAARPTFRDNDEIERPYGERIDFDWLPDPHRSAGGGAAGGPRFRWAYGRLAEGRVSISIDEEGRGVVAFDFIAHTELAGERFGAAMAFVGADDTALHTIYALADSRGNGFRRPGERMRIPVAIERPPGWWEKVAGLVFFSMTYHPQQELDDAGIKKAMRRAVHRITKGRGSEEGG